MIDVREIMTYLPHRYPFLLVDRVLEFEADKKAIGYKNVTFNEEFFQGHFPGQPIMPGVLILEALAQMAAILAIKSLGDSIMGVYFMSIDRAKFRKPVIPGDQLRLEAELIHARRTVWKVATKAYVEDKLVCEAEMTAMVSDKAIS